MATRAPSDEGSLSPLEYHEAEGFPEVPAVIEEPGGPGWTPIVIGLVALVAILSTVMAAFALAGAGSGNTKTIARQPPAAPAPAATPAAAPTLAQAKGI